MVGLCLIDGGIGCSRSSCGGIQRGLSVSSGLLLCGERLLGSLCLALGSGHLLRGSGESALALRLDRLGGVQRGSGGVHLGLGGIVLRARGTLLGAVEIGLGGVVPRLGGVHVRICRCLCLLSCRKLALCILLPARGGISSHLGIREPDLRVGGLLLRLLQLARGLLGSSLSRGNGLGGCVGRSSLRSLERGLGIVGRLLGCSQGLAPVRQVLLGGIERSLSVLERLHVRIGLVLSGTHLLLKLGRSGRNRGIACATGRIVGALSLLLVGGGGIVRSSGRIQIGLSGSSLCTRRIDRSLQVGDLLCRRHRTRTGTNRGGARQRRQHGGRLARSVGTARALRHRSHRRQQRAARHGNRRRGNRRHAPDSLNLARSATVDVDVLVLAHCRFLSTMSCCLTHIVDPTCPAKKR